MELIKEKNQLDILLYDYAEKLFLKRYADALLQLADQRQGAFHRLFFKKSRLRL